MAVKRPLYEQIALALGEAVAKRIARSVIRHLCGMRGSLLSGDDTPLRNMWDEICVQKQLGESVYWSAYRHELVVCIAAAVEKLRSFEQDALWLLTPEGDNWIWEDHQVQDNAPVCHDDIVGYLERRILSMADDWTNARIERYRQFGYSAD